MRTNIKWFFTELLKMWSNEPSYFSKKRVESSILFITALILECWYLIGNMFNLTSDQFLMHFSAIMVFAGYTVSQIQKEKKNDKN